MHRKYINATVQTGKSHENCAFSSCKNLLSKENSKHRVVDKIKKTEREREREISRQEQGGRS